MRKDLNNSKNFNFSRLWSRREITDNVRKEIQKYSKNLFLNTQINSFNSGHHTLRKYKKVNTLCINESELRYEMKDRVNDLSYIVKKLYKEISFNYFVVTRVSLVQ